MLTIKWSLVCQQWEETATMGANLFGVIEDYVSETVPLYVDQMTIVLGTELSGGTKANLEIQLLYANTPLYHTDPTANRLIVEGDPKTIVKKNIPMHFGAVVLPKFGKYTLEVLVNGKKVHSNSFRLLQVSSSEIIPR
jgi:hypothetical protein